MSCAHRGQCPRRFDKIILISIDTLRADYLGAYGAPVELTPEIDSLAGSGVLFDDAITSATSTLPSHTSFFYSVHTFIHNAYTGNPPPIRKRLRPSKCFAAQDIERRPSSVGDNYDRSWA